MSEKSPFSLLSSSRRGKGAILKYPRVFFLTQPSSQDKLLYHGLGDLGEGKYPTPVPSGHTLLLEGVKRRKKL